MKYKRCDILMLANKCVQWVMDEQKVAQYTPKYHKGIEAHKKQYYKTEPNFSVICRGYKITVALTEEVSSDEIIYKFTPAQAKNGLTGSQWDQLVHSIARVLASKNLYDRPIITDKTGVLFNE